MALTRYERRKYAKGMRRVEFGIWGHLASKFWAVHLTTRAGDDMSTERMGNDLRKLVRGTA